MPLSALWMGRILSFLSCSKNDSLLELVPNSSLEERVLWIPMLIAEISINDNAFKCTVGVDWLHYCYYISSIYHCLRLRYELAWVHILVMPIGIKILRIPMLISDLSINDHAFKCTVDGSHSLSFLSSDGRKRMPS